MGHGICRDPVAAQGGGRWKTFIKSKTFLHTWQGSRGLVQPPRAGEPFASDLEALVSQLRASSEVLSNFDALRKRVAEITYIVKADHWACSLELCTSTWGTEKVVRIHGHASFARTSFGRMKVKHPALLSFKSCQPHKATWTQPNRGSNMMAGIYCLTANKYGSIFLPRVPSLSSTSLFGIGGSWICCKPRRCPMGRRVRIFAGARLD